MVPNTVIFTSACGWVYCVSTVLYFFCFYFKETFTKGKLKLKLWQNRGFSVPRVSFNDLSMKML